MRINAYIGMGLICVFYWVLDSIWSYLSFEHNLKNMIFREPASILDTFLLHVPPYQMVARLMVVALFLVCGSIIIEFAINRRRAEKQRREAHATLLTILDGIDATIYVADMQNHEVLFMNRYMIERFGGDYTGRICHEVFRGLSDPCDHCTNDRLLDASGQPRGAVVWEGYNPVAKAWYINYDRAVKWIDGRMVRLQIATDITRLKELQEKQLQAEAQLRQARKMESIGNLAAGIAHDFNNILFPIIGMAELLLDDLPAGSLERENALEIFNAGKRGSDLVKQILAFSRQSERRPIPLRIQQIAAEALKLGRSTLPANIDIVPDLEKDCGLVLADPVQVHQIVMNLITNAAHAIEPAAGRISVTLRQVTLAPGDLPDSALEPGSYARLSVADTGCGIAPEVLENIFDPYFTTKESGKGTGLGLAVVYGIVKEFNGDIRVASEKGRGTTFDVYLPLMPKRAAATAEPAPQTNPRGSERILLVDDEESIVRLEQQMLAKLGYRVTVRNSSVDALEAFRAAPESYDLVITDLTMPNLTGDELAREIRAIRPHTPILICTGFSERFDRQKAQKMGISGLLMKPVVASEMARAIRRALDE